MQQANAELFHKQFNQSLGAAEAPKVPLPCTTGSRWICASPVAGGGRILLNILSQLNIIEYMEVS